MPMRRSRVVLVAACRTVARGCTGERDRIASRYRQHAENNQDFTCNLDHAGILSRRTEPDNEWNFVYVVL